jgi:UDP-GlcNAc:undecaprenyl-phosphate GlcNAc-1-phosphate transferase
MPMTAVWLFAIPLLDTATLIWRRWREGRSALHADQHHLHHVFLRAGYSVVSTWGLIVLFAVSMAGIGIVFEVSGLPGWVSFYAFMLVAFSYYFYLKHAWSAQKFLGRHFIHHDFEIDESVVIARKS